MKTKSFEDREIKEIKSQISTLFWNLINCSNNVKMQSLACYLLSFATTGHRLEIAALLHRSKQKRPQNCTNYIFFLIYSLHRYHLSFTLSAQKHSTSSMRWCRLPRLIRPELTLNTYRDDNVTVKGTYPHISVTLWAPPRMQSKVQHSVV